jgi:hypothetical protein
MEKTCKPFCHSQPVAVDAISMTVALSLVQQERQLEIADCA